MAAAVEESARIIKEFISVSMDTQAAPPDVHALVEEAVRENDVEFGYEEAARWAAGFSIPTDFIAECEQDLQAANYDLAAVARQRQQRIAEHRLSHASVDALLPSNPERQRLHDLVDGMQLPVAADFYPNGRLPGVGARLRPSYVKTADAVNKMMFEQGDSKLCLVVRASEAARIEGAHFSPLSWTPKKGKESGRPIGDLSDGDGGPRSILKKQSRRPSPYGAPSPTQRCATSSA